MYKPQREMKKLERLNERLFKEIECSQISNLASIRGGERVGTCESRTVYNYDTKKAVTNWYSDNRLGHMTNGGWVWDELPTWTLSDSCKPVADIGNNNNYNGSTAAPITTSAM